MHLEPLSEIENVAEKISIILVEILNLNRSSLKDLHNVHASLVKDFIDKMA